MLQAAGAAQHGDFATASRLFAEELHDQEPALGEQHPYSLATSRLLIRAYRDQGRVAQLLGGMGRLREELALNEQFHRVSQDLLGERHPVAQWAMASLAASRRVTGQARRSVATGRTRLRAAP